MYTRIVDYLNTQFGTHVFALLVPGYIHMLALAFVFGGWVALRNMKSTGLKAGPGAEALLLSYIFSYVGARALEIVVNFSTYREDFWGAILTLRGGLVAYGGFIGGVVTFVIVLRLRAGRVNAYLDCAAPGVGVGIALTRIGCFLNGCCYGKATGLPWGIRFPRPSGAFFEQVLSGKIKLTDSLTTPLHPTQFYSSLSGLIMFGAGMYWLKRKHADGVVFWKCCALYACMRFTIEFFRNDPERGFLGPLSTSQALSLVLVISALIIIRFLHRRSSREARSVT